MFTGLVEALGTLRSARRHGVDVELRIDCPLRDYVLGESIAVHGVCLSVTTWGEGWFCADASAETLAKTSLGGIEVGEPVHLERALAHGARLGGHLVTGHVDGVGRVCSIQPLGDAKRMTFSVPPELAPFLAPKGSVTIDGISLTVNGATGQQFDVVLVPITQTKTTLATRRVGAVVNLEVDVLAKYVARLLGRPGVDGLGPGSAGGLTLEHLARGGYV